MYSIFAYGKMIVDNLRMDAYMRALRQVIKPGSVVLDIGTGTGIFALLACQLGSRRVYAIEPDDAIEVARETAAANGYAERIEFIQSRSTEVTLPERADVIVSDLRGVLPLFASHIPSVIDARRRFLAPGGTLIPRRDTLWVAVVEAPDLYGQHTNPWDHNGYGLDMRVARQIVTNTWGKVKVTPEQLLVEPQSWAILDYAVVESPDVSGELTWTVARAGVAHGLSLWFDAALAEGVHLTNAPGEPELIYGNAFFPLSQPVPLAVGDMVSVVLQARLIGEDYIWRWNTCILDQGDTRRIKASFAQSTFFGTPLSSTYLRKRTSSHVPMLNEEGQIDLFIIGLMDGINSLGEIARQISSRFPTRFATWRDAMNRVGELSKKYSQ